MNNTFMNFNSSNQQFYNKPVSQPSTHAPNKSFNNIQMKGQFPGQGQAENPNSVNPLYFNPTKSPGGFGGFGRFAI